MAQQRRGEAPGDGLTCEPASGRSTRICIGICLSLAACAPAPPPSPAARAADYLVSRQGADGLWKSETTPPLSTGQVLTPFVLYALSHAPADVIARHRAAIDRGLDRLPVAGNEYPGYALALSITALRRLRPAADRSSLERELRARRLDEANGWSESDPEYGGWDQGLLIPTKPQAHRPDVSVTAFAVEALGPDAKSARFAERCRSKEGGFFFTPSAAWGHQNKAGPGAGYGTATLDAQRILGGGSGPGPLKPLPPEWEEALFFYRAFARAKAAPDPALAREVAARQRPDGSFANASALMKEDDPLVATGLALVALSRRGPV